MRSFVKPSTRVVQHTVMFPMLSMRFRIDQGFYASNAVQLRSEKSTASLLCSTGGGCCAVCVHWSSSRLFSYPAPSLPPPLVITSFSPTPRPSISMSMSVCLLPPCRAVRSSSCTAGDFTSGCTIEAQVNNVFNWAAKMAPCACSQFIIDAHGFESVLETSALLRWLLHSRIENRDMYGLGGLVPPVQRPRYFTSVSLFLAGFLCLHP